MPFARDYAIPRAAFNIGGCRLILHTAANFPRIRGLIGQFHHCISHLRLVFLKLWVTKWIESWFRYFRKLDAATFPSSFLVFFLSFFFGESKRKILSLRILTFNIFLLITVSLLTKNYYFQYFCHYQRYY